MPHILVKCLKGKSEEQKKELAEALTKAAVSIIGLGEESFSVGIEEIEPEDWKEKVYIPDIIEKKETLYKEPGYKMD
ncbi:MAG TPA: tautomerase family protein [Flavisolibacter sp.]|nr:tautomerase family protein [Flavisolibacter sp.]